MVNFATGAVILTFLFGNGLSCLALWTIHMSKTLRDSFGFICKYQMLSDLTLVSLAAIYTLIPISIAPPSDSPLSMAATSIGEVCFFFSAEMHYLFALNRFVCIVFPEKKQAWRRATPRILIFCASIAVVRTFIMSLFDADLYWVYDRKISVWHMTHTKWTDFYEEYFEVYWSMCEIAFIMILDAVTFAHLINSKSKINNGAVRVNRRAEIRLILQSLCQCLPTTTVTIVYYFVFQKADGHINWGESWFLPMREENGVKTAPHLLILLSCMWYIANSLDAIIIIVFHFPQALISYRKKNMQVVTLMTSELLDTIDIGFTAYFLTAGVITIPPAYFFYARQQLRTSKQCQDHFFRILHDQDLQQQSIMKLLVINGFSNISLYLLALIIVQFSNWPSMYGFYTWLNTTPFPVILRFLQDLVICVHWQTTFFISLNRLISLKHQFLLDKIDDTLYSLAWISTIVISSAACAPLLFSQHQYHEIEVGELYAYLPAIPKHLQSTARFAQVVQLGFGVAALAINFLICIIVMRMDDKYLKLMRKRPEQGILASSIVSFILHAINHIIVALVAWTKDVWIAYFITLTTGIATTLPFWMIMIFAHNLRRTVLTGTIFGTPTRNRRITSIFVTSST